MGFFDQSLFILLLVVILLGFEIQIVRIYRAISVLNEKIDRK